MILITDEYRERVYGDLQALKWRAESQNIHSGTFEEEYSSGLDEKFEHHPLNWHKITMVQSKTSSASKDSKLHSWC